MTTLVALRSCRKKAVFSDSATVPISDQPQNVEETSVTDDTSEASITYDDGNDETQTSFKEELHSDLDDVSTHQETSVNDDVTAVSGSCFVNIEEVDSNCAGALSPSNSNASSTHRVRKPKTNSKPSKANKGSKASLGQKIKSKLRSGKRSASVSSSVVKKPKYEYPRLCVGCAHAYKTKQSFWNHKQRCPLLPQNMWSTKLDENGLPVEGNTSNESSRRREYICAHCERHYRKKCNLRQHLKNSCRGKPCSKGRLQCWVDGCLQAFYKYVDLVQHVTIKHGQDLQIQKLQFPNFSAFNTWKTEESKSKFMYARKITGSKRFSNTRYHYFVCQFNHRNEKKNSNRKTNRRKKDSLVVPNYNCPSRIMVKECDNQILVTYISSHNHELNLSNVKYQPLEKEARGYIKTLLQLDVTPQKIIDHLRAGVGNPEIDSFLATKQHFLTLNRIKRMESKLKAKNRVKEKSEKSDTNVTVATAGDSDSFVDDSLPPCDTIEVGGDADGAAVMTTISFSPDSQAKKTPPPAKAAPATESDEVIRSIESNLKKLKGYLHKNTVKEKLSTRISKMIQELCDECETMEGPSSDRATKKRRMPPAARKRKTKVAKSANATDAITLAPPQTVSITMPAVTVATITASVPGQTEHIVQPIMIQHQQPLQLHPINDPGDQGASQTLDSLNDSRIVNSVVNSLLAVGAPMSHDTSFTPAINETTDLLKPVFQPFNISLLALKSIDRLIPEREQLLLQQVDSNFSLGWVHDAILNSFLNLACGSLKNVLAVDTSITENVPVHQTLPEVWRYFDWANIDTIFIPCNPSKKQWILMVVLVKQLEVQILDPTGSYDDAIFNIYKKHETTIQCWYELLRSYLGISQWNVTSPQHNKHPDPVHSGVLICWFVMQYINKRSLVDSVDLDHTFRQFMYNTIVNNSSAV